jgi:signal transduction histidine kinase
MVWIASAKRTWYRSLNDTGPGLPLGESDQIFDAFFTTKSQGSGMGLAISKSIVESHGGRIWVNDDGGHGATFHFTLPTAPAETPPGGCHVGKRGQSASFGANL